VGVRRTQQAAGEGESRYTAETERFTAAVRAKSHARSGAVGSWGIRTRQQTGDGATFFPAPVYSTGGEPGVAASIGMLNGRSILIALREMNDGSGGPLERASNIVAATCRSSSFAAVKSC
jgi:hypothetical protein